MPDTTTTNDAREAIQQRFLDWRDVNYPGTTIVLGNEAHDATNEVEWFRLTVRNIDADQETLNQSGARRFLRNALIFVQVFTPANTGMQKGDQIAHDVLTLFEAVDKFDGVYVQTGRVSEGAADGRWQEHLVEVSAFYEETK